MCQTGLMNLKQEREVSRLKSWLVELWAVLKEILAMKERLKTMTIEHLLSKSPLELALDDLLGKNR